MQFNYPGQGPHAARISIRLLVKRSAGWGSCGNPSRGVICRSRCVVSAEGLRHPGLLINDEVGSIGKVLPFDQIALDLLKHVSGA